MLAFTKYQGLGNDFLLVDMREAKPSPSSDHCEVGVFTIARALCDRRLGVGGDGVLLIEAPRSEDALASMRVLNADGSVAQMCGNGLRCVVKHLLQGSENQATTITIDTGAGALTCSAQWSDSQIIDVTVNMGRPRILRSEIPVLGVAESVLLSQPYRIGTRNLILSAISMGNPHAVTFVPESGEALMQLAMELGPRLETHSDFPERCNAEFAHVLHPESIELVVWERGVGITQACGTGACATAVAACKAGLAKLGTEIRVNLPGGPLFITVDPSYESVWMRGPAEHVFSGHIDLETLLPGAYEIIGSGLVNS